MSKIKASENSAKDVETPRQLRIEPRPPEPLKPAVYEIPEPLLVATINYIANSIPRLTTVQETNNLINTLQRLKKIKD